MLALWIVCAKKMLVYTAFACHTQGMLYQPHVLNAQIWQWREHGICTADDGMEISAQRIEKLVEAEVAKHQGGKWRLAGKLVAEMLNAKDLDDFLTTVCYPYIVTIGDDSITSKL